MLSSQSKNVVASFFLAAIAAVALVGDASSASAAPGNVPAQSLDIELKGADVKEVFRLLGDVSKRDIDLDPCVQGRVDIKLQNTPLPLVFDAFALKLGLVYDEPQGGMGPVHVSCGRSAPIDARARARASISERDVPLDDVAKHLADLAKLDGVDYRTKTKPKVTIALERVRVATIMTALAETTDLIVRIDGGKLIVEDPVSPPTSTPK